MMSQEGERERERESEERGRRLRQRWENKEAKNDLNGLRLER